MEKSRKCIGAKKANDRVDIDKRRDKSDVSYRDLYWSRFKITAQNKMQLTYQIIQDMVNGNNFELSYSGYT